MSVPGKIAQGIPVRTGLAIGLVGQSVSLPLQVLNNVLVIRMLGTQVGLFFLFTTTTMLLSLVLDPLGLKWAATYLIGREAGRGRSILRTSLLVCAASGIGIALLGPFALRALAPIAPSGSSFSGLAGYARVLGFSTALNLLYLVTNAMLLGYQNFAGYNLQQVASAVFFSLSLLVSYAARVVPSPLLLMVLWTAAVGLATILGVGLMAGDLRRTALVTLTLRSLAPGMRAFFINSTGFLHLRVDYYMVSWMLGASRLSIYGTAVTIAEALGRLVAIVGPVVYAKSSAERGREFLSKIPILLLIVALSASLLGALFACVGRPLLPLVFGAAFGEAYVPTLVLLPGIVFMGMTSVLNNFMAGKGYPISLLLSNTVALVVNVSLNSFLIRALDVTGASVASSVSYGCWFLALALVLRRHLRQAGNPSAG